MAIVKTSLLHRANQKVQYSNGAVLSFDEELKSEVEDIFKDEVLTLDESLTEIVNVTETDIPLNTVSAHNIDVVVDGVDGAQKDDEEDDEFDLSKYTVKQLQELANDAGISLEEYKNLNKTQLIELINSKLA